MSFQGTTSSRRKIDYVPPYEFQQTWWRAGPALRAQAIRRTKSETYFAHDAWGIDDPHEVAGNSLIAASLNERVLGEQARVRLSLLRAVNI